MAAEDLGDLQAEILQVKHAIRSDTPRPVHGCEAAANRGKEVPGERQRPTNPHVDTAHDPRKVWRFGTGGQCSGEDGALDT